MKYRVSHDREIKTQNEMGKGTRKSTFLFHYCTHTEVNDRKHCISLWYIVTFGRNPKEKQEENYI